MHVLACRHDRPGERGRRWYVGLREHETVGWSQQHLGGNLRDALKVALAYDLLKYNWTFSERQLLEIGEDLLDHPEETLNAAQLRNCISFGVDRSVYLIVCAPEGLMGDRKDRWAELHRPPGQELSAMGMASVFRPQNLRQRIMEGFFGFDLPDERLTKSFVPGTYGITPPSHLRELWVRPGFRARQLCPGDFPKPNLGMPQPRPWPARSEAKPAP